MVSFMRTTMDDSKGQTKYFQPIEFTNQQRLEIASMMDQLKEDGVLPGNTNMGAFVNLCYLRGLNEYKKDSRLDA
jgi:hypothetical protein